MKNMISKLAQECLLDFANPNGNSALRKPTASNPRNQPCQMCGGENLLTPKDVDLGYCCDRCADMHEGIGIPGADFSVGGY